MSKELIIASNLTLEESYKLNGCFTEEQCQEILKKLGTFSSKELEDSLDMIGDAAYHQSSDITEVVKEIDNCIKQLRNNLDHDELEDFGGEIIGDLQVCSDKLGYMNNKLDERESSIIDNLTSVCNILGLDEPW